jgi:CRP-like cAMP-binding protein
MSVNRRKSLLLVASDQDFIQQILEKIEDQTTRIITATNDAEARLKLGAEEFQFVIIDLETDGLKPVQYVENLRSRELRRGIKTLLPVILIGPDPEVFQSQYTQFELTSFLEKPLDIEELKTKLAIMKSRSVLKDSTRQIKKDSVLMEEDSSCMEMYWVLNGSFVATKMINDHESDGQEHVIGKIGVGELIGEMSLLDNMKRSATVRALEDSEVLVIPHKKFLAALDGQPRWLQILLKTISLRLRNSNEIIGKNKHSLKTISEFKEEIAEDGQPDDKAS